MTTAVAPQLESDQEAGALTVGTHNGTSSPSDTAGVIAPPPLIYLSALGIGFGLDAVIGTGSLPSTVAVPVGAASIITGAGLMGSFVRALQRARTPVDPYTPSEAIVTDCASAGMVICGSSWFPSDVTKVPLRSSWNWPARVYASSPEGSFT